MTREEFEEEYAFRHMSYDPRGMDAKIASVNRLRSDNGYSDTHIDLCWKLQMLMDVADRGLRLRALNGLKW
jgi:hypothetical protein